MRRFLFALIAITTSLAVPVASVAQSNFSAAVTVGNSAITAYEIEQRARFLRALRAPGAGPALAREQLIDDRLKMSAATRAGAVLQEEGLQLELESFAARANLTIDEFLQALAAQGVERETLEDFVTVGVLWRELVRARFGSRAQISDAEIDRALGQSATGAGIRVLLNEIILPARPGRPGEAAKAQRDAERLSRITSTSAFSREASRLSVSQSRARGGRLDWVNLVDLPQGLAPVLIGLKPGEVAPPLTIPNAIVLFQLRAIEEVSGAGAAPPAAVDYAALYLPGGRSDATLRQARRIEDSVDTCDDLYGVARKMPREALERGAKSPSDIPQDVALELAKLDAGETSISLTRAGGETLVFLMMCSRVPELAQDTDRDAIRNQLRSQRLAGFADAYLEELRADTVIVER